MADDDDDEAFGGAYEEGHWIWDENSEQLVFVSDRPPAPVEAIQIPTKAPTGTVEFRDDVDLIEQIRFRRRYQRKLKPGQPEIITVQDVKDIALYTAPVNIMSPVLINMLHLPTTERFIRALILYCAYYLQVADEMTRRILELETKVRTPVCEVLECEYRDNLADLRLLVAKEYSTMLIAEDLCEANERAVDVAKVLVRVNLLLPFRLDKEKNVAVTLENFIIWVLKRKGDHYQTRMRDFLKHYYVCVFRSYGWHWGESLLIKLIFNSVEHTLKTDYLAKMAKEERDVLLGYCVRHDKKLCTKSPLMNEVFCHRQIDYRLMGLGVIKFPQMTPRLHYMHQAVSGDEEHLSNMGVVLGIVGMPRSSFDTMLRPLPTATGKSKASMSSAAMSSKSSGSMRKSTTTAQHLYPDIVLPKDYKKDIYFPSSFPDQPERIRPCSETQRRRWQNRLQKLLHPQTAGR